MGYRLVPCSERAEASHGHDVAFCGVCLGFSEVIRVI